MSLKQFRSTNDSIETQIGRKLEKSFAVDESNDSSDDEVSKEDDAPKTQWEQMHDIYFQKRFSCPLHASVESLMDDEDTCKINISNMYSDSIEKKPFDDHDMRESSEKKESPDGNEKVELSDDTLDVIDDLIKSFEKECQRDEINAEVPIINVEENFN